MDAQQVAFEAGVPVASVLELVAAGVLHPDTAGMHQPADVSLVRLAQALAEGGIGPADLAWAIESEQLPFDRVGEMWAGSGRSDRTFAEFVAAEAERGHQLLDLYAALGLAAPPADAAVSADEERVLRRFLDVWSEVDERPEVALRAARIAGDGVRRIVAGTLDVFDEHGGSPPDRLRRGLRGGEAMTPSFLLPPMLKELLLWLQDRHTEHEVFERIVGFMERKVAQAGRAPAHPVDPPAIAFVDLTGYTAMTETDGDARAAESATTLQTLATRIAAEHRGRLVKQLGDGVLMRFTTGGDAIAGVRALMTTIADAGLSDAHAGIAVGPFVVRDGDVYGRTVNLAARIAGHAGRGELLLPSAVASELLEPAEWSEVDEVRLKGIPEPVRLARVRAG
jgi:class 3 adenylate cyclase